jgi:hypothetical protein
MAIVISRVGDLYTAVISPPHGAGVVWTSPEPMAKDSLIHALREHGCHQTDIGDAFYDADPEWLIR